MRHDELKDNDIVIFKTSCDILEMEDYQDGNVIYLDEKNKRVGICWLEGYKSRSDSIPYEKVIARYNPKGKHMTFGIYSGNSDLLTL